MTPENHGVTDMVHKMPNTAFQSDDAVPWSQDNYVLRKSIL